MGRKFTTPEGLTNPPQQEHNCRPLYMSGRIMATCKAHYGQAPVLRNDGMRLS